MSDIQVPPRLPEDVPLEDVPDGEYLIVDNYRHYEVNFRPPQPGPRSPLQIMVVRGGKVFGLRQVVGGPLHIPPQDSDAPLPDFDFPLPKWPTGSDGKGWKKL